MDFTDRGTRQPQQIDNSGPAAPAAPTPAPNKKPGRLHRIKNHKLLNITYITLLFSVTILIAGVALSIFLFDGGRNKENDLIDTSKYQAVFLNGGQVYFGKISDVNNKYLSLSDIYYLTPNQAVQSDSKNSTANNNNFTIRKLGCELHRPQNVMVINHDQIIFWENLKDDSSENTVPGAIKKLSQQTQNCEQQATTGGTSTTDNNKASTTNDGGSGGNAGSDNTTTTPSNGQ